ncbi:MAG: hypothetical protein KF830_16455 [Planctomycetes bacterium]|nr:hypothetical protein [Planctomycetota bacterium]
MPPRPPVRLALSCLALLLPAAGCKGPPQGPPVETAGLTITVLKVKNERKGLDTTVRIYNGHDMRVSFDVGGVRLICPDGTEISPNAWRTVADVQAKNSRDFRWVFSYQNHPRLQPGTYDVEIKGLKAGDIDLDLRAQFQFVVGS